MVLLHGICHSGAKLRADTCYTISLISALKIPHVLLSHHSPAGPHASVVPPSLSWGDPPAGIVDNMPTATIFTGTH